MKNILTRTLETTVKKSTIIIEIIVGVLAALMIKSIGEDIGLMSYQALLSEISIAQHLIVFLLIDGTILMFQVASNSTELIANEIHEGTFRLLLTKPNSRNEILSAKLLGAFIGQFILNLISLFVYYAVLFVIGNIDANIYGDLISYLPGYIAYGLIVNLIFTAISLLLSCIFKKKLVAFLPVLAFAIVIFGIPMTRIIGEITGSTASDLQQALDVNYHFGLLFNVFVPNIKGKNEIISIFNIFTNLFKQITLDPDISHTEYGAAFITENTVVNKYIILGFYLLLSTLCIFISYRIIKKKDV